MKAIYFFLLICASVSGFCQAEEPYRDFKNQEGTVIRARLVGKEEGIAVLRRTNGKEYRVPIKKLAQADQEYVDSWKPEEERQAQLRSLDVAELFKAKGYAGAPFKVINRHLYVEAKVDGKAVTFILDTGAMGTLLDKTLAQEMKLEVQENVGFAVGLSGKQEPIGSTKVKKISIGDVSANDREFMVVDLKRISNIGGAPFQGILGYDFLSDLEVVIDYRGEMFYMLQGE